MPHKTSNDERRRETRYTVANSQSIRIAIRRMVEDREERVKGTLLDLSQGGAKILVPACLQFSEVVELTLTIPNLGLNIDANSQVCWIRPAADNQWLVGCSFTPNISEEALGQLASAGIVERRDHPRHPVEMLATACWESEDEPFPVVVRDYSANGFCMSSIRPGKVGQGVSVDLNTLSESDRSITGKVRWQIEWKGEYLIGCMMNDDEDFEQLCDIGGLSADGNRGIWSTVTNRVPEEYRRFVLPTASWIAIFASSMLLGLSVPVLWHLTSNKANVGAPRLTTVSLAEGRDAADDLLVPEQHVPEQHVPEQHVPEQQISQNPPMQSAEAPDTLPRAEIQAADSDLPTQNTDEPHPVSPTPKAQQPVAVHPSTSVATREPDDGKVHVEAPSPPAQPTSDDTADSTTRAPAEDLSMPARVVDPNEPETVPPPMELEDAQRQIQAFIRAIVGDDPKVVPAENQSDPASVVSAATKDQRPSRLSSANHGQNNAQDTMPRRRPRMLPGERSDIASQTNRLEGVADRIAQAFPGHHINSTVDVHRTREAWLRGAQLYRSGQFSEASEALRDAAEHDPRNALYGYLLAMSRYQMGQFEAANQVLKRAIQLERSRPIENWGTLLSRYQGHPRLWVERHRSAARRHLPQ